MTWQNKVLLEAGERIIRGQIREKGHLGQTEILPFTIVNKQNEVVGEGKYTEHTAVRGLHNSYILEYTKKDGTNILERW